MLIFFLGFNLDLKALKNKKNFLDLKKILKIFLKFSKNFKKNFFRLPQNKKSTSTKFFMIWFNKSIDAIQILVAVQAAKSVGNALFFEARREKVVFGWHFFEFFFNF